MRLEIKNGRIIDPSQNLDQITSIYLARGRIAGIGEAPEGFSPDNVIDAEDKWILPGLVDLQVRLGEPGSHYAGSIASETQAAVAGGITSLCCPPDTAPVNDSQAVTELIQRRARQAATAFVMPIGALTQGLDGERLSGIYSLIEAGCVALSQANRPIQNALTLKNALEYTASHNTVVMLRSEDQQLKNRGVAHSGPVSSRLGLPENPPSAETTALARDLVLVEEAGIRTHFSQISCARSVEMIAEAKKRGLPVTCDVAIHQLHLSEMDVLGFNSLFHVSPPLRGLTDRKALLNGLKSGVIDAVVSDHTPLHRDDKLLPYGESKPGISGLETLLPLLLKLVREQNLDLMTAISSVTHKPASIIGMPSGSLKIGRTADLSIIDPQGIWSLSPEEMISEGKNSPFIGWEFEGKVEQTFFQGRQVYRSVE
ncbi:dihydroorotase [Thiomicrorhabdus heinhorstiae]|uniref:Dihydroorotase n=1 Tax=Thiomicrorhabdus heinhorstiae TaxID=2748010 RepID=A0ABS0BXS7_9GAMM|nr:dihydroorotase [Thiomicrorhabdus heinhorstiae]MBF6057809.1 dihydroorotase [Thiomicrorhabdus heinhorstiae]